MSNIKLKDHNWDTTGIYDSTLGKTQRQVNADLTANKVNTSDYAPATKTSEMTQSVGKDSSGKLWTTPVSSASIISTTENWLSNNVDPDTGYVLDRSLSVANAAAPADLVGDLKSSFNLSLDQESTKNLFDKTTMTDNLLIDGSGNTKTDTNYITSDYIFCPTTKMTISSIGASDTTYKYRIAVYDGNKVWQRRNLSTTNTYTLDGVRNWYIRISFEKARGTDFNTVQVETGNTATSYVMHNMPLDFNGRKLISELTEYVPKFNSIKSNGAFFSLCDDDTTSLELVDIYHNLCAANNVKGCYAVITFRLNDDANLANKLLQYEEEGFGVYYHCKQQIEAYRPNSFDESLAQPNFVQGLREFTEYGFLNTNIWLTPYGGANDSIISMARRHGIRYLVDGMKTVNPYSQKVTNKFFLYPSEYLSRFAVTRYECAYKDLDGSVTLAALKSAIDDCATMGGWIIITSHTNTWYEKDEYNRYIKDGSGNLVPIVTNGETGESRLSEIIQYCLDKGMENKTISEGLSIYEPVFAFADIQDKNTAS